MHIQEYGGNDKEDNVKNDVLKLLSSWYICLHKKSWI